MHFDPVRRAYIDNDTDAVVYYDEEAGGADTQAVSVATSPSRSRKQNNATYSGLTVAAPKSKSVSSPTSYDYKSAGDGSNTESEAQRFERLFELAVLENQQNRGAAQLEEELYHVHVSDSYEAVNPAVAGSQSTGAAHGSIWEDWNFARTLQAMEFEIHEDDYLVDEDGEPITDFERKEYHASRSCRRQLLTISCFIVLVQIGLMVAMIQIAGYAPQSQNSVIGPPVYIMVRFGAKESALMIYKNEWYRLLAPIMLHAGIFHLLPNIAIQLRVGGYLNLVYGTPKWLWIYFISGIYGVVLSCLFLPNAVGVGSSGSLMGMLSSWVVWIIFRWEKIPARCRSQRNCQLAVVSISIVVTLATGFMPNVDWAAHLGGAVMGVLWGVLLLGNELDNTRNQRLLRLGAAVIFVVLFTYSMYYLCVKLDPSRANLSYWAQNDDWGH